MNELALVFRAVATKSIKLRLRYLFNTLANIGMIYVLFLLIFLGGRTFSVQAVTDSLSGIIVGFFLFTVAQVAFSRSAQDVIEEAQWGTLERLFMTPLGFGRVIVVKTVVNVALSLLIGTTLLVLMMVTTGRYLSVDLLTVAPLLVLSLGSAVGVGFLLAGFALVYKRVENVFPLVQFGFMASLALSQSDSQFVAVLPLATGMKHLQMAMDGGQALWQMPTAGLLTLLVNGVVYSVVGYLTFLFATRVARSRGVLGHY